MSNLGGFFAFEWLENLYLDTLVINEITCFLKKVLILLVLWLFFMAEKVQKKLQK
jgi:hypothetical protein